MDDLALLTEKLPDHIVVSGRAVRIDTRWHVQIDLADIMQSNNRSDGEKLFSLVRRFLVDYHDVSEDEYPQVVEMWSAFHSCTDEKLEKGRTKMPSSSTPLFDFWNDARLIIGAFQQVYGLDLFTSDMHWWRFLCLLESLPSSTRLSERMQTRGQKPSRGKGADHEANRKLQLLKGAVRVVPRYTIKDEDRRRKFQASLNALNI